MQKISEAKWPRVKIDRFEHDNAWESAENPLNLSGTNFAMPRIVIFNIVGLTSRLMGSSMPNLRRLAGEGSLSPVRPAFPAVTCTAQASLLTGTLPGEHGIVANGWYDRDLAEVHFWKQPNRLVNGAKLWDKARLAQPGFTCANLFWWFNRYSSVDFSITPRPIYCADGRKVFDIASEPYSIALEAKAALGEFPFHSFWGPRAGIASSRWIAQAAMWMEERHRPSLNLVYLPHLDYNLQRFGPESPSIQSDLREIDGIVGDLATFFENRGVSVIILSEYGITPVRRPVYLNRVLRGHGWLSIKDELGLEILDCGLCKAFAVADHQVAHVYVNDPADTSLMSRVRSVLEETAGVESVLDREAQAAQGLWHRRSGDFLVVAEADAWFSYQYWEDDSRAPDFARTVDIHRKPGYDPAELFIDPAIRFPALRVAGFLLRKRLGLRGLLKVVPLDDSLVRGSHGRIPEDPADHPVLLIPRSLGEAPAELDAIGVHQTLLKAVCGGKP